MRTAIQWLFRGVAIVAALLATIQPVLGSFAFFRRGAPVNYELIHLVVGAGIYNLAILLIILALFSGFRRRWIIFLLCLLQYVCTHIQLRLGLGSNANAGLLAYHIPLGVLIFFLSYLTVALAFDLLGSRQPGVNSGKEVPEEVRERRSAAPEERVTI